MSFLDEFVSPKPAASSAPASSATSASFLDEFMPQPTRPASEAIASRTDRDALEGLPYANRADERRFRASLNGADPEIRQRVMDERIRAIEATLARWEPLINVIEQQQAQGY